MQVGGSGFRQGGGVRDCRRESPWIFVQDLEETEEPSLEGYLFPETYSFPIRTTSAKGH